MENKTYTAEEVINSMATAASAAVYGYEKGINKTLKSLGLIGLAAGGLKVLYDYRKHKKAEKEVEQIEEA